MYSDGRPTRLPDGGRRAMAVVSLMADVFGEAAARHHTVVLFSWGDVLEYGWGTFMSKRATIVHHHHQRTWPRS